MSETESMNCVQRQFVKVGNLENFIFPFETPLIKALKLQISNSAPLSQSGLLAGVRSLIALNENVGWDAHSLMQLADHL